MGDVVLVAGESSEASGSYEAFASLNEGFLGTGFSTSVEISFIAMAFIAGYVAISTGRYFLDGTNLMKAMGNALGLGND